MTKTCLTLAVYTALLLPQTVAISGTILDRGGKPIAHAQVVYTNLTDGKIYKLETDKKGAFASVGVAAGNYKIEITAPDGSHVYSAERSVGLDDHSHALPTNILNVDLSTVRMNGEIVSSGDKKQAAQVRKENADALGTNRLILDLRHALDARNWQAAVGILRQLITIEPNRWEYYQNLGSMQSNLSLYEDAAQTFAEAIELARKAGAPSSPEGRASISRMLISQADAYSRLGKVDLATASYTKAAAMAPRSAQAHYYACNALRNKGNLEGAITECNQAIASDPIRWEFYQIKAEAESQLGDTATALEAYEIGIQMAKASLDANVAPARAKVGLGQMLDAEGNVYVQLKQYDKAIAAFTQATGLAANPALPYFNLCALQYNANNAEPALAACEKAIASDPGMADAYFVKASILFGQGNLQQGKYQAPDGTSEALSKYLELSPEGQHVADARAMLENLGATIDTTFKPKRK